MNAEIWVISSDIQHQGRIGKLYCMDIGLRDMVDHRVTISNGVGMLAPEDQVSLCIPCAARSESLLQG